MILSILICTIVERRTMFERLKEELDFQAKAFNVPVERVEVLFERDNKEISVGKKRQKLLLRAVGDYVLSFDDDDWPNANFVFEIMMALESKPDCVGLVIDMTTNNSKPQVCCHSLRYPQWRDNVDGYDYVRNVTHRNPVRRDLALKVGFEDLRFGEDRRFSDKVTKLCKTEIFIEEPLFHYRYDNHIPFKRKYGIR